MPDILLSVGLQQGHAETKAFIKELESMVSSLNSGDSTNVKLKPVLDTAGLKQFKEEIVNALGSVGSSAEKLNQALSPISTAFQTQGSALNAMGKEGAASLDQLLGRLNEIKAVIDQINGKNFNVNIGVSNKEARTEQLATVKSQLMETVNAINQAQRVLANANLNKELSKQIQGISGTSLGSIFGKLYQYNDFITKLQSLIKSSGSFAELQGVADNMAQVIGIITPALEAMNSIKQGAFDISRLSLPDLSKAKEAAESSSQLKSVLQDLGVISKTVDETSQASSKALEKEDTTVSSLAEDYAQHVQDVKAAAAAEAEKKAASDALSQSLKKESQAASSANNEAEREAGSATTHDYAEAKRAITEYYDARKKFITDASAQENIELGDKGFVAKTAQYEEFAAVLNRTKTAFDLMTSAETKSLMSEQDQTKVTEERTKQEKEYALVLEEANRKREEKAKAANEKAARESESEAARAAKEFEKEIAAFDKIQSQVTKFRSVFDGIQTRASKINIGDGLQESLNRLRDAFQVLNDPSATPEAKVSAYEQWKRALDEVKAGLTAAEQEERKLAQDASVEKKFSSLKATINSMLASPKSSGLREELLKVSAEADHLKQDYTDGKISLSEYTSGLDRLAAEANNAKGSLNGLGNSVGMLVSRFEQTLSLAGLMMLAFRELKQMVTSAVELDTAMTQLRIVTNGSNQDYIQFSETISSTAKEIGASTKDLIDSTTVFARLGYSLEESGALSKYTAMLSNVGDIDVSSAQSALTAITKAYGISAGEIESVMDKMVTVGNNFPISVSELAEGMNNAGSALSSAGNSFEQSIALLTAANTTVQNISKSSTGLRTITARIRGTKLELDELGEAIETAKYEEALDVLTKHRVALTDNGEFRSTYDILKDIAAVWGELSSMEQANIAEQLAGNRQQNVFFSIVEQFREASNAMTAMGNSAGALDASYSKYLDSIEAHTNKFKATFTELSKTVVDSGIAKDLVDMGSGLLEGLTGVFNTLNNIGGVLPIIVGAVSTIVTLASPNIMHSFVEGFKAVKGAISIFKGGAVTISGLSGIVGILGAIATLVFTIVENAKHAREEIRAAAQSAAQDMARIRSERDSTVETSIQRIQELKQKIADGGLSSSELYNAQTELLNIKGDLVNALGEEANNIDILGDSAEAAAGKIRALNEQVSISDAESYLAKNTDAYKTARKEIEDYNKTLFLGYNQIDLSDPNRGYLYGDFYDRVAEIVGGYKGINLIKNGRDGQTLTYQIEIDADARDAKEELTGLSTDLGKLKREFSDRPVVVNAINDFQSSLSGEINAIDTTLSKYEQIYNEWQVSTLVSKYGEGYKEFLDASKAYNDAVNGHYENDSARAKAMADAISKIQKARKDFGNDKFDFLPEDASAKEFLDKLIADLEEDSEKEALKLKFRVDIDENQNIADDIMAALSAFADENGELSLPLIKSIGQLIDEGAELNSVNEDQANGWKLLNAYLERYGMTLEELIADMVESGRIQSNAASGADQFAGSIGKVSEGLETATERYNAYKQALEGGEMGDLMSQYASAYNKFKEDMEAGRTGSNAVRAAANLLLPTDRLADLGYDLAAAAQELSKPVYEAIFTDEGNYGENFVNYLHDTFGEGVEGIFSIVDNGNGTMDFFVDDWDALADLLKLDKDLFAALRDELGLYGPQIAQSDAEVKALAEDLGLLATDAPVDNMQRVRQAIEGLAKITTDPTKIRAYLDNLAKARYLDTDAVNEVSKEIQSIIESVNAAEKEEPKLKITDNTPEVNSNLDKLENRKLSPKELQIYTNVIEGSSGTRKTGRKVAPVGVVTESNASGTKDARGGKTLVNELGPELISENGQAYIAGGGKPAVVDLDPHAIVLNAEDTKKALNGSNRKLYKGIPIRAAALSLNTRVNIDDGASKKKVTSAVNDLFTTIENAVSAATVTIGGSNNGSGSGGHGGRGGGGSSKSGSNWFEEQYAEHKHLLEMDKESEQDFLDWLDDAYKRAYEEQLFDLKEYRQHEEEVYKGRQDDFKDHLNDVEHLISLEENGNNDPTVIYNYYVQMMADIEKELDKAYAYGLDATNEYVQYLQNTWNKYQKEIKDKQDQANNDAKKQVKDLVDYRIKMLKQYLKNEIQMLKDRLSNLKDFYSKQKEMLQDERDEEKYIDEQAEKRKAVTDIQAELSQLENDNSAWAQKRKKKLQEELEKAQKTLDDFEKDHALKVAQDQLDAVYEAQEKDINAQVDALQDKLDDPKYLYEQALEDVRNNSVALYEEMIQFNNKYGTGIKETITEMWEEAYVSLKRYFDLYNEYYKGINLVNATGYVPDDNYNSIIVAKGGGYASGTSHATKGLHRIDELGAEYVFTSSNGDRYRMLSGGDKVLDADSTNFLYRFATAGRSILSRLIGGGGFGGLGLVGAGGGVSEIRMGDIIIQGNTDERTVSEIRRAQRDGINTILKEFSRLKK